MLRKSRLDILSRTTSVFSRMSKRTWSPVAAPVLGLLLAGVGYCADTGVSNPPVTSSNGIPPFQAERLGSTPAFLTVIVLVIGYVVYVLQAWKALYEAKRLMLDGNGSLLNAVLSVHGFQTWGFIFFSFGLAIGLPLLFHIVKLKEHSLPFVTADLFYYMSTQTLLVLILLEFSYLFELFFRMTPQPVWQLLMLIALGLDFAMWLFLMLIGEPQKGNNWLPVGLNTSIFLALTLLISFSSSALIIVLVRKIP